jgi:hypothetical protein
MFRTRLIRRVATTVGVLSALVLLSGGRPSADEAAESPEARPATPSAAADSEQFIDLHDQVEVIVTGSLRSAGRTRHAVSVVVKNVSADDLTGPLVLVVDGTGVEALALEVRDGTLSAGQPYVQVLAGDRRLAAGQRSRATTLEFSSADALTANERRQFALQARVGRLNQTENEDKPGDDATDTPRPKYTHEELQRVIGIQDQWTKRLVDQGDGAVFGTGIAEDDNGNLVVRVYTLRHGTIKQLPGDVDGVPLQQQVIGTSFKAGPSFSGVVYVDGEPAAPGKAAEPEPDPGADLKLPDVEALDPQAKKPRRPRAPRPTSRFPRPVPIGVSSLNDTDICAAGTLGCRCRDSAGLRYGLSNNHVFAEINGAVVGDPIVQPGLLDNNCVHDPNNVIGTLVDFEQLGLVTWSEFLSGQAPVNVMDAAVALSEGQIDARTPLNGYGEPATTVQPPQLNLQVKKFGRTTSLTNGNVVAINVQVVVQYTSTQYGWFTQQIQITPSNFSRPGDSGSLIVTRTGNKPVGLLFAGGGGSTIANPIGPVLNRFALTVDDGK